MRALRVIRLEEEYALPVCVVHHSEKALPALKNKSGSAADGSEGCREVTSHSPEATIEFNSFRFTWID